MKTLHFYNTNSLHNIKPMYFTLPLQNRTHNKGYNMPKQGDNSYSENRQFIKKLIDCKERVLFFAVI